MELVIDIGNSNVVVGVYKNNAWMHTWRLETIKNEEFQLFYQRRISDLLLENDIHFLDVDHVYMSSVVPQINNHFCKLTESIFGQKPKIIKFDSFPKSKILIDNPSEMGTDLIANAVAAVHKYQDNCIIVDFGTALTFTVVKKNYEILGVAITPGLKTAFKALYGGTAQLPEVTLRLPKSAIGKNTTHSIQAGISWGYIGLIKSVIAKIAEEHAEPFTYIATGGLSSVLTPLDEYFHYADPSLTLDGIRIIGSSISG